MRRIKYLFSSQFQGLNTSSQIYFKQNSVNFNSVGAPMSCPDLQKKSSISG